MSLKVMILKYDIHETTLLVSGSINSENANIFQEELDKYTFEIQFQTLEMLNIYHHLLSLLDGLLCALLFAYIFLPIFNMNAIWYSYVFNGIITTLAIFIFVWINNKNMPKNMSDLMMLDDDFGTSALEIVNIELYDESEVNEVSKQIQEFCDNRGINKKTSYYAALAMEEMASNIISHGFKKDNKKHSLEARVVHKNNIIIFMN